MRIKSDNRATSQSASGIKLLQAASDLAGGTALLAKRLEISESLLKRFLNGRYELPPQVLVRAVDIVEELK